MAKRDHRPGDEAEKLASGSDSDEGPGSSPAGEVGVLGRIRVHPAGYGFVEREDALDDVFVPAKFRGDALDGDRVKLRTWEGFKGTEGRVTHVVSRGRAKLTGTLCRDGRSIYLEPDDPRIATAYGRVGLDGGVRGAKVGTAVVAEISTYPSRARPELRAKLVKVIGDPEDPRTEIEKIIICGDIPDELPEDAMAAAASTPDEVTTADLGDRIDLRDRPFVTIDPETARDFDDALCIETGPHGPRVWIAVADVSHYVAPAGPLDEEARIRGVSVYLPDRVIPMLPFALSAGICSLNPHVDRLAMVVRLDFDRRGRVHDTDLAAAVIRSHARLDYPGVAAALAGDFRGRRESYRAWEPALRELSALAQTMRGRRLGRGSLDLDIPEAKVILDEDDPRLVRDVVRARASEDVRGAYQLVEEMMIAANEAVGRYFSDRELPTVWRVHAPPAESRAAELAEILAAHGVAITTAEIMTPAGLKAALEAVAELPSGRGLAFLALRSLKQAIYSTDNVGHFGLASTTYLHFTSPIRRFPDVMVHRLLKYHLHREGKPAGGGGTVEPASPEQLAEAAAASSSHERRAIEAEREAVAMYRATVMREHVGERVMGVVSAVTSFGAFVEIDAPFVEGLIKLEALGDDFFVYDPQRMTLAGRNTGFTIGLGDDVEVEVIGASPRTRRVDFRLVNAPRLVSEPRGRTRRRASDPPRRRKGR